MKNTIKVLGIIALAAVIGFSMAGCGGGDDDSTNPQSGGGTALDAPSLSVRLAGKTLYFNWTPVSGASWYKLYITVRVGGESATRNVDNITITAFDVDWWEPDFVGVTFDFWVAAFTSNGREGAWSNVQTITVTDIPTQITTSLNGVWELTRRTGTSVVSGTPGNQNEQITISGNTARFTRSSNSPCSQDAARKGFLRVGDVVWQNITKSGNTWTAQTLEILVRTKTPDVAAVTTVANSTLTLSSDGRTLTKVTSWKYDNSSGTVTDTYIKQ